MAALKGSVLYTLDGDEYQGYDIETEDVESLKNFAYHILEDDDIIAVRYKLDDDEAWAQIGILCDECLNNLLHDHE